MGLFRRTDNRQIITGIFLLVLLAVFAGPNTLPRLLANIVPIFDEGTPCDWLKASQDRSVHQSLIGRAATTPLALTVRTSPIPSTPDGKLTISVTVINTSVGTIPIVFNPRQVIIGDNGTSGFGITFNPASGMSTGGFRQETSSYPESDIRLLGPRQRCVYKLEFLGTQIDPVIGNGAATVSAYYRNNSRGQITQINPAAGAPIFPDQGLWIGFITSEAVTIPVASQ